MGKSCRRVGEGDPPGRKVLAWVGQKYLMDESNRKEGGGRMLERITADVCMGSHPRGCVK